MSRQAHNQFLKQTRNKYKNLHKVIKNNGAIRLIKRNNIELPTLLCRSINSQQISVKAAASIWGRLQTQASGKNLISHIRNSDVEDLRACGLSGSKTKAMQAVAQAKARGILNVRKLQSMDIDKRNESLTSIWGVGQWTANMLNIFYFGEKDVWPDKDVAVRKNFLALIGNNNNSIEASEAFAPYRSYLALHMWRHANARPD